MIRIVTDSAANIPVSLVQRYNIAVIPLNVHFGEECYQEGVDISNEEFYRRLPQSRPLPTTSQPSAGQFRDTYQTILSAGDEVLSIHLASNLSGTYSSAATARSMIGDAPISLFDSGTASVGLGMIVLAAAQAVKLGWSREEIIVLLEKMAARTTILFTVDTLEYLRRGGRIGAAAAWAGTLLQLKPVLAIRQGKVLAVDRIRTRKRSLARMLTLLNEQCAGVDSWWCGVAHIQAEREIDKFAEAVRQQLPVEGVLQSEIGPVVGTHGGPGTIGVALTPAPSTFHADFPSFSDVLGGDRYSVVSSQ